MGLEPYRTTNAAEKPAEGRGRARYDARGLGHVEFQAKVSRFKDLRDTTLSGIGAPILQTLKP
jgi:hypothetical protein